MKIIKLNGAKVLIDVCALIRMQMNNGTIVTIREECGQLIINNENEIVVHPVATNLIKLDLGKGE